MLNFLKDILMIRWEKHLELAVIFGATGGVMEAALRTVAEILEGKSLENFEYTA